MVDRGFDCKDDEPYSVAGSSGDRSVRIRHKAWTLRDAASGWSAAWMPVLVYRRASAKYDAVSADTVFKKHFPIPHIERAFFPHGGGTQIFLPHVHTR